MDKRPSVIFVLGGPGAGKGTQCTKINDKYGFKHISAGDCLREERAKADSLVGQEIERHIVNGTIVPVKITVQLLRQKMTELGWEGGKFLIDGFPRNQENLDGWMAACGGDVNVILCLDFHCPEEVLRERLIKRGQSSGRSDDNLDSIVKRFRIFREETVPILRYFENLGLYRKIDATKSIDEVWQYVQEIFENENLAPSNLGGAAYAH